MSNGSQSVINYLTIDGYLDSREESIIHERFFEFNPKEEDYMYRYKLSWDVVTTDVFHIKIGNKVFGVPSTYFIMIGDYLGEVDWIMIDELIGREIECVSFDKNLESWSLHRPKLVDVTTETFQWPLTSNIVPSLTDDRVILVSNKDQHYNTKTFLIDSFTTV